MTFGEISNKHFAANFVKNLRVKKIENRVRIKRVTAMSLVSLFLAHGVFDSNKSALTLAPRIST